MYSFTLRSRLAAVLCLGSGLVVTGCIEPVPTPPGEEIRFFQTPSHLTTDVDPFAVAAADLDGDGRTDLVSLNRVAGTVSVFLSEADGGFAEKVDAGVGTTPSGLVIAEINGDAFPDILTANTDSDDVTILLGAGDGSFTAGTGAALLTGSAPLDLAVADFNGDAVPDIATADSGRDTVSVMLGIATGGFSVPVPLGAGGGPRGIIALDIDGDSAIDIATVNRNSNDVSLFRGLGDGTFAVEEAFSTGGTPRALAAGLVDGDAFLDLVVTNPGTSDISILFGTVTGGFDPEFRIALDHLPTRFVLRDLNNDGRLDIATTLFSAGADPAAMGLIAFLAGDGAGDFAAPVLLGAGRESIDVIAARLSGDVTPSLITADIAANQLSLIRSNGDGTFHTERRFPAGDRPRDVRITDLDHDGNPDLVVNNLDSEDLSILLGDGDAEFDAGPTVNVSDIPRAIAVADLNKDGDSDVVATNLIDDRVSVFLGDGDGTFAPERRLVLDQTGPAVGAETPRSLAVADVNLDGNLDLITGNTDSDNVSVLLGRGDGTFDGALVSETSPFPLGIHVALLDDDAFPDIISTIGADTANALNPRLVAQYGTGDGLFSPENRGAFVTGTLPTDMALADLNADGTPDAVTLHTTLNSVFVYQGLSNGRQVQPSQLDAGTEPNTILIADVAGDGRPDIITIGNGNTVTVLQNRGSLNFVTALSFRVGSSPIGGAVDDVDRDGNADLVFVNRETNDVSLLLGLDR